MKPRYPSLSDYFTDISRTKIVKGVKCRNHFIRIARLQHESDILRGFLSLYRKSADDFAAILADKCARQILANERTIKGIRSLIICGSLRLVVSVCKKYMPYVQHGDIDELIQEGNAALVSAAEKFELKANTYFSTFACLMIRQRVIEAASKHGLCQSKNIVTKAVNVRSARRRLALRGNYNPSIDEIIKDLDANGPKSLQGKWVHDTVQRVVVCQQAVGLVDVRDDLTYTDDDKRSVVDCADDVAIIEQALNILESKIIRGMDWGKRYALVIRHRFGLGTKPLTLQEVGDLLGVSRERVRQMERRALRELRDVMADIHSKNKCKIVTASNTWTQPLSQTACERA